MPVFSRPIANQGRSRTCGHHTACRIINQRWRVITGDYKHSIYDEAYEFCERECRNMIRTDAILEKMLEGPRSFIVEEVRNMLRIQIYNNLTHDIATFSEANPIVKAVSEKRYVAFGFNNWKRISKAFNSMKPVTARDVEIAYNESEASQAGQAVQGHDMVLKKIENGCLYLANSHGTKFASDGVCCVDMEVLQLPFIHFRCIDLCYNQVLPVHIQKKIDSFIQFEDPRLPMVPLVNVRQIKKGSLIIGRGGSAVVYNGTFYENWHTLGKSTEVAVRYEDVRSGRDKKFQDRLFLFNHRNIVEYYGFTRVQDAERLDSFIYHIAMKKELYNLEHLYDHVNTTILFNRLGWGWFYCILLDIAEGLNYLHKNHVYHTDICPVNIVVSESGVCKIIDLQSIALDASILTEGGGHVKWISEDKKYRDVFALGCLMCYLITGKPDGVLPTDNKYAALSKLIASCKNEDSKEPEIEEIDLKSVLADSNLWEGDKFELIQSIINENKNLRKQLAESRQYEKRLEELVDDTKQTISMEMFLNEFRSLFENQLIDGVKVIPIEKEGVPCIFVGECVNDTPFGSGVVLQSDGSRSFVTFKENYEVNEFINPINEHEPMPKRENEVIWIAQRIVRAVLLIGSLLFIVYYSYVQLSRDVSFLNKYDKVTDNVLANSVPPFLLKELKHTDIQVVKQSKHLLKLIEQERYLDAFLLSVEYAAAAKPSFLPWVCMPIGTYNQSEYIFGNPVNLTSAGPTIDEIWRENGVDFMFNYMEVLFQVQLQFFRSVANGNIYMGTSDANMTPKCRNPITKVYYLEELKKEPIVDFKILSIPVLVNVLAGGTRSLFTKQTLLAQLDYKHPLYLPNSKDL